MRTYVPQSSDTTPAVDRFLMDAYRRMSPTEKMRRIGALGALAASVARADIRRKYPAADEREIRLRLAARTYPRELMIAAFGWDPDVEGY